MHAVVLRPHGRKSRSRKQTNASRCILMFQTYYIDERTPKCRLTHQ